MAFFRTRAAYWNERRSVPIHVGRKPHGCRDARYLARLWAERASLARRAYEKWHRHEYAWREWLPAVWKAIIQCETGSRHDWNSGSYQGAYGFAVSSWDAFRPRGYPSEAYLATPREQWNVALAIHARYGFSGWGCA